MSFRAKLKVWTFFDQPAQPVASEDWSWLDSSGQGSSFFQRRFINPQPWAGPGWFVGSPSLAKG